MWVIMDIKGIVCPPSWFFPVFRMIRIGPTESQELIIQPSSRSRSCRLRRQEDAQVVRDGAHAGVPGSHPVCGCQSAVLS